MGSATTFAELIATPYSEKVFLAEIKPGQQVTAWTATGGLTNTYEASYLNETVTLADSSTETIRKSVVAVELDGTALTVRASTALVDANAGSYFHDTANSLLYVHAPDSGTPAHHVVIAYFWLYFATKGIVLNSVFYEPYIAASGIPSINKRLSELHYGTTEIGSGSVVLLNGRGYFDQIAKSFIWTNKKIKILLGGDSLAYSEYTSFFVGKIIQTNFSEESFTLDIRTASYDLLRDLPINDYWTSTYANLDPSAEGLPIPYYWGVYDINQAPVVSCINSAYGVNVYQFKICDTTYHAIKSITQVYIDYEDGAGWQTIAHANEDLNAATFTITAASFVLGISRVKVAFEGYHSGGVLIEGAPEIVEDILLNQCGYVSGDLDSTSFTASKTESSCVLNVHVDAVRTALSVVEQICASDIAYFDEDGDGLLRYRTFSPAVDTSSLPVLDKHDILEIPDIWEDYNQLYYRVKIGYSYLCSRGNYLFTEDTENDSLYKYGKRETLTVETYIRTKTYADYLATKLSIIVREPVAQISLRLKAGQITKELGDQVKVTLARAPFATAGGYDERIFEIKEKSISAFPLAVDLVARDSMDFFLDIGIWVADAAPDWSAATAQERDESGFWTDSSGFCDSTDYASLNKSRWW